MIVCTGNQHKVAELRELLPSIFELQALDAGIELPPETGDTFEENARIKATAGAKLHPKAWIVADDSGLEIDALDRAPGVRSARWAADHDAGSGDAANIDLVMHQLSARNAHDAAQRTARFRCVLVAIAPDGREFVADGVVEGHIADRRYGTGGFGYDPVFVPAGYARDQTFASLAAHVKRTLSHRAVAAARLATQLTEN